MRYPSLETFDFSVKVGSLVCRQANSGDCNSVPLSFERAFVLPADQWVSPFGFLGENHG